MQIMNVIFFSTVILSLNMVYFKSTALFMHDVTINLVPPKKSSLLEPKSATIAFIASFLFPFFPSRSLHFSKLTQNILKIARINQSSLIQLNKKLKFYSLFKQDNKKSLYLDLIKNANHRLIVVNLEQAIRN